MSRMEQNETGCETPQAAILCVNNCGFFGTAATMNMCSKCYKDLAMKQDQTKLAASSIQSLVNGSPSSEAKDPDFTIKAKAWSSGVTFASEQTYSALSDAGTSDELNHGPKRCGACKKRVGLTGFNCRCGHIFCSVHRYSDKHDCPFNYRAAGQEAISKANPVVKAQKLDRI